MYIWKRSTNSCMFSYYL